MLNIPDVHRQLCLFRGGDVGIKEWLKKKKILRITFELQEFKQPNKNKVAASLNMITWPTERHVTSCKRKIS